jgi:hypothetical protein
LTAGGGGATIAAGGRRRNFARAAVSAKEAAMMLGLSTYTWVHTALSLVALVSGVIVLVGLFKSRKEPLWTAIYLVTAVATSATGFGFPFTSFGASHWVGVISLVLLAVAIAGLYVFHLAGAWRWLYVVGAVVGLYFLVFVAIAQAFMKVPALHALAPTATEPPFGIAELAATAIFVVLAIVAAIKFRPVATPA